MKDSQCRVFNNHSIRASCYCMYAKKKSCYSDVWCEAYSLSNFFNEKFRMASSVYFFCTALFATYNSATVRCETLTRGWEDRVRFYNIHHIIYASQVDDGDICHKMMVGSMRYGVVAFPTKWRCSNWVEWLCYIYSMYYLPII